MAGVAFVLQAGSSRRYISLNHFPQPQQSRSLSELWQTDLTRCVCCSLSLSLFFLFLAFRKKLTKKRKCKNEASFEKSGQNGLPGISRPNISGFFYIFKCCPIHTQQSFMMQSISCLFQPHPPFISGHCPDLTWHDHAIEMHLQPLDTSSLHPSAHRQSHLPVRVYIIYHVPHHITKEDLAFLSSPTKKRPLFFMCSGNANCSPCC